MRLFVALDIDDDIRRRLAAYVADLQPLAPRVRWVTPQSLHLTLKFIGERPETLVPRIENCVE